LTKPQASILVPVWNAEVTLEAALRCALGQTMGALEVLVVLNGVTDRSGQIARDLAASDPRLRIFELPKANLAEALQWGLERCAAELVVRHDADDHMEPTRVAAQVTALRDHPDWLGVTCKVRCVGLGEEPGAGMVRHVDWLNSLSSPEDIRSARFIDAPLAHPAVTFRRDAVLGAGGYRDGDFPEDHELWLRLMEGGARFGRVDEELVHWTDRADRFTRTDPRCRDEARRHLVHSYLGSGPLSGGRRARIWGAGPFGKRHARDLHRRLGCVDALIDIDPKKVGRVVAGGLTVISMEDVGPPDGRLTLLAVGSPGARGEIATFLEARGHVLGRDFLPLH
jgi:glycosyltransferase involved in cell wall biosynthesis